MTIFASLHDSRKERAPESGKPCETMFQTLFDAIPSSILVLDDRLRILMANRNFLRKGNRRATETIGRRFDEVFPPTIFERTDILDCVQRVFIRNAKSPSRRMTFRGPGVPMRTYYYCAMPFNWSDRGRYALFLMEDITEQVRLSEDIQRVERHLAGVVESASDILVSTDIAGGILSWNRAAERLTGYRTKAVLGRLLPELFAPSDRPAIEHALANGAALGGPQSAEWALETSMGGRIAVSWTLAPMLDESGKPIGMVAAGRDLTERYRLEAELMQSQKLAALGVMAGGIAHEIRNPLAVASSAAQFLLEESLEPELRDECARKTIAGIHKASQIIENLLRFARPEAAEKMTRIDPVAVLHQAVSMVEHQASLNRIEIQTRFFEHPYWVRGVASLLEQAFINILLNAIAAMPGGGLLAVATEIAGDQLVVRVRDTGIGIDSADLGRIFDPFYTCSPVARGTGLGLSICYSIIRQHQGRIEVESQAGLGTCFHVSLPLAEQALKH
ncbi:MAG: PAS domain-containing sensor histidine kinase [Gammaproteobacteria bacterium]|nr:PAS domain-containing sensor histidine kinase [Gammaproteobacteria bacterium]